MYKNSHLNIAPCSNTQLNLALHHEGFFMVVRKLDAGKWICECYPAGRRMRKQFATKGEALPFERRTMEEVTNKPWLGV